MDVLSQKMCCYECTKRFSSHSETFLNLEEEEFYNILKLLKSMLSKVLVGNNLIQSVFALYKEEQAGGRQSSSNGPQRALK